MAAMSAQQLVGEFAVHPNTQRVLVTIPAEHSSINESEELGHE